MYRSFYGLERKPFQMSTNPIFVWLGDMHKEALALFKYGILENQGVLLLTGDVGTGKTTLINALTDSLDKKFIVAKVPDPGMETIDFMNYLSYVFDMKKKFVSKDAFLIHFGHFLQSAYAAGKKVLLIIDEAQRLNADLLEEVRQLSNIENRGMRLLNIFLIGQNEFIDVLKENKNRALYRSISINYVIKPLDVNESAEFMRYRLKIAGTDDNIFTPDAIREIQEFSGGFPRRINIICDYALVCGFSKGEKNITGAVIRKCAKDLCLPGFTEKNNVEFLKEETILNSEHSELIPPECLQIASSGGAGSPKLLRTVGMVLLGSMIVVFIAYLSSPDDYRGFLYRFKNNEIKLSSALMEANVSHSISSSEADTQKAKNSDFDIQSTMLILDENSMESSAPTQSDNFHSSQSIKKDIAGDEESADILLDRSFQSDQQALTRRRVTEGRLFSSETAAALNSAIGPVNGDAEIPGIVPVPESSVLAVEISVAEEGRHGVIEVLEGSDSGKNENESKESENTTIDSTVDSTIEDYMAQNKSNDVPYVPEDPGIVAMPLETEEVLNDSSGNIDPSAVIDWVIKNRSE